MYVGTHECLGLCCLSACLQEIEVGGKKAIVIQIPVRLQRQFQKVQTRLIRELEKKFSGRTVVFMAWVGASWPLADSMHSSVEQLVSNCPPVVTTLVFGSPAHIHPYLPSLSSLHRGGSYQNPSGTSGPSRNNSAPAAEPSPLYTTPCWRTWSSRQRSLGRGFVSVLTAAGLSRCTWTGHSKPTLSTRWVRGAKGGGSA